MLDLSELKKMNIVLKHNCYDDKDGFRNNGSRLCIDK